MPEAPKGGRQDATFDLQAAGFMSTGTGYYWSPGQVRQVRRALITRLLAQEFEDV